MTIKVKRLHPDAVLPTRGSEYAAGYDLTAVSIEHNPETSTYDASFGIAMEIPEGHAGFIFPRSSVKKTGFSLTNCVGVIDSDYRGEIKASFYDITYDGPGYSNGERCAQIIILPVPAVEYEETTDALTETARGAGGFGSTGR